MEDEDQEESIGTTTSTQRSFNSNCEKLRSRRESHVFNLDPSPTLHTAIVQCDYLQC